MVERSGVSPEAAEQQTFDSEIFDLELDAGLPSTQGEGAPSTSTTPEAPSDSNDDTEWLSEMRPASEPVPLAPTPLSASYVVSYSNSDPQDGWGNLLGTSEDNVSGSLLLMDACSYDARLYACAGYSCPSFTCAVSVVSGSRLP